MAQRRAKGQTKVVTAWKDFWQSPEGKIAIGALFREYGFYDTPQLSDPALLARSIGQRDVLVRISQLVNMKPELAPDDDGENMDILDRVMRSH